MTYALFRPRFVLPGLLLVLLLMYARPTAIPFPSFGGSTSSSSPVALKAVMDSAISATSNQASSDMGSFDNPDPNDGCQSSSIPEEVVKIVYSIDQFGGEVAFLGAGDAVLAWAQFHQPGGPGVFARHQFVEQAFRGRGWTDPLSRMTENLINQHFPGDNRIINNDTTGQTRGYSCLRESVAGTITNDTGRQFEYATRRTNFGNLPEVIKLP